jgi:hypothetical protein
MSDTRILTDRRTMESKSLDDVLSFSLAESEEVIEKGDLNDGLICSCGHAWKYHKPEFGYCLPGRQACRCNDFIPVLKVSDTRYFMRKSQGNGKLHALSLGIAAARLSKPEGELEEEPKDDSKPKRTKRPVEMKWNLDICCMKCRAVDVGLSPTMVSLQGQIVYEPEVIYADDPGKKIFNLLLCDSCIDEVSTVKAM